MTKIKKSFCIAAWSKTSCVGGDLLETDHCFFALGINFVGVARCRRANISHVAELTKLPRSVPSLVNEEWRPKLYSAWLTLRSGVWEMDDTLWRAALLIHLGYESSYAPEHTDKEPCKACFEITLFFTFVTSIHQAGRKVIVGFFYFPDEKSLLLCWHPWKVMLQCYTVFQKSEGLSQLDLYNTHTHLACYLLDRGAAKECRKTRNNCYLFCLLLIDFLLRYSLCLSNESFMILKYDSLLLQLCHLTPSFCFPLPPFVIYVLH